MTDFFNMMRIKFSTIFHFCFTTDLASSVCFLSSDITGLAPARVVRYFTPSPIPISITTIIYCRTGLTKTAMPKNQNTAIRAWFFIPLLIQLVVGFLSSRLPIVNMQKGQKQFKATLMAPFSSISHQFTAVKTRMFMFFSPSFTAFFTHIDIITNINQNVKPKNVKRDGRW